MTNLPLDIASRLARARVMGFRDVPVYHGTANEFRAFDLSKGGQATGSQVGKVGISVTPDPRVASEFALGAASKSGGNPRVLDLKFRSDKSASLDLTGGEKNLEVAATLADAFKRGYDSIVLKNYTTPAGLKGQTIVVVRDPSQLRSGSAAFDPAKKNSGDLLASVAIPAIAAGGVLLPPADAQAREQGTDMPLNTNNNADYTSDAKRRRRTIGLLDPAEPAPGEEAGLDAAMAVLGAPIAPFARLIAAAPRAIGAGMGGLLGMSGANESEAQGRKSSAKAVDPADAAAAEKLPEHLRPQYLDLASRNRDRSLNRAEREQFTAMNKILSDSVTGAEAATREREGKLFDAKQADYASQATTAEEARQKILRDAPKPFNERFPEWNSVQGFLPAAVAAATTLPIALRGAAGASKTAGAWRDATAKGLAATDAPTLAASNNAAQAFAKEFPKPTVGNSLAPYAVPGAIGAIEGAGIANAPEAYNSFLPPENPELKAYQEYIKVLPPDHPARAHAESIIAKLPKTMPARDAAFDHFTSGNFAKRLGVGAIEGMAGAAFGTTLAKPFHPSDKGLPRAQTQALQDRISGTGLEQANKAIAAESQALGTVLPIAPARQQLQAHSMPPPRQAVQEVIPPGQPIPSPQPLPQAVAPGQAGYDPIRTQLDRMKNGAYGVPAVGVGAAAMSDDEIFAIIRALQGQQPGEQIFPQFGG